MDSAPFKMSLYLPAQGAAETEATIIEWYVAEGDRFEKGQVLAQVDSAKSVFDFEAPCSGLVIRLFHLEGDTVDLVSLKAAKLIRGSARQVKIIAAGEVTRALAIRGVAVSKGARTLVETAGGKVEA